MNTGSRRPRNERLGERRLRGLAVFALAFAGAASMAIAQNATVQATPGQAASANTAGGKATVTKATTDRKTHTVRRPPAPAAPPAQTTTTVQTTTTEAPGGKTVETTRTAVIEHKAGEIITQPARDVGISKLKIPPVLVKARDAPYDLHGLDTCQQIANAVAELSTVLGPDFVAGEAWRENRSGKLVEAGGRAVVNSLIPYRGLVREVTGAAPQQRRLDDAVSAGFARRGFLRGLHDGRRCKNAFAADLARENRAIR